MLVGNAIANKINLPHCLSKFELVILAQLENLILHLKPTTCLHDILPNRLFKEVVDTIGPNILLIINNSLFNGIVPLQFKYAVIESVLKRINLDSQNLKNVRPIFKFSKLSIINLLIF